jgi:hypothetical protein
VLGPGSIAAAPVHMYGAGRDLVQWLSDHHFVLPDGDDVPERLSGCGCGGERDEERSEEQGA